MQRALVDLKWLGQFVAIVHPFFVGNQKWKEKEGKGERKQHTNEKTVQALDTRCVSEATADVSVQSHRVNSISSIWRPPAYIMLSAPLLVGADARPSRTVLICSSLQAIQKSPPALQYVQQDGWIVVSREGGGSVTEDDPVEYVSVPKISTVHQGFAGTFTHMDGSNGEEKERKKHLWSLQKRRHLRFKWIKTQRTTRMALERTRRREPRHCFSSNNKKTKTKCW